MHLSTLSITDVRQFENRTFNFSPGFNLLVGENGAGKTTIFRALLAVLGDTPNIRSSLKLRDEDIRLGRERAIVDATVGFTNGQKNQFHYSKPLWGRISRTPRGSSRPLILSFASNEAVCRSMKVKRAKKLAGEKPDAIVREQEFLYFASESELANDRLDPNVKRFGNSQQVRGFIGAVISTFSTEFEDFYWRFEPYDCSLILLKKAKDEVPIDAKQQEQLEKAAMRFFQEGLQRRRSEFAIWRDEPEVVLRRESQSSMDRIMNMLLEDVWGHMDISPDIKNVLRDSLLKVKLTPRIMIERPVGPLKLDQLSDGEQRLFSLFVDIARELSLQEGADGRIGSGEAIVLIDEIDVHLHPKWQRKIVPALEDLFPNCQFIATTHSPFVIQAMSRQNIVSVASGKPINAQDAGNSIEDIAEWIQGVVLPQRSSRAEALSNAAQKYFALLESKTSGVDTVDDAALVKAETNYREASEPFTSNPAVHALLKVQLMERGNS